MSFFCGKSRLAHGQGVQLQNCAWQTPIRTTLLTHVTKTHLAHVEWARYSTWFESCGSICPLFAIFDFFECRHAKTDFDPNRASKVLKPYISRLVASRSTRHTSWFLRKVKLSDCRSRFPQKQAKIAVFDPFSTFFRHFAILLTHHACKTKNRHLCLNQRCELYPTSYKLGTNCETHDPHPSAKCVFSLLPNARKSTQTESQLTNHASPTRNSKCARCTASKRCYKVVHIGV